MDINQCLPFCGDEIKFKTKTLKIKNKILCILLIA